MGYVKHLFDSLFHVENPHSILLTAQPAEVETNFSFDFFFLQEIYLRSILTMDD